MTGGTPKRYRAGHRSAGPSFSDLNGRRRRPRPSPAVKTGLAWVRDSDPAKCAARHLTSTPDASPPDSPSPKNGATVGPPTATALGSRTTRFTGAHAEALAFASIPTEATPLRLTGQDTERGTFSHRHPVLHDPSTGATYTPMQNIPEATAPFEIYNSPLSEMQRWASSMDTVSMRRAFSYCGRAQFGDFANGAQVIIDQFLSAGSAKWRQIPSLMLLLPHGYEGQGPEHSSARLERFLQLAARTIFMLLTARRLRSISICFAARPRSRATTATDPDDAEEPSPASPGRLPGGGPRKWWIPGGHRRSALSLKLPETSRVGPAPASFTTNCWPRRRR